MSIAGTSRPALPTGVLSAAAPSQAQRAYDLIKVDILSLAMRPGMVFSESDLSVRLGLSRTPIREALSRLRTGGLVESAPRSGYRVTPVTVRDARELFSLRTLIEGEAAALAAARRADLEPLQQLDQLCQIHYDPSDPASIVDFLRVNAEFHLAIAERGGNRRLTAHLSDLMKHLQRYMHLGLALFLRADEIVHEHRDLLAAITSGDVKEARRVAVEQSTASQQMVIEALLSSEAIQLSNLAVMGN